MRARRVQYETMFDASFDFPYEALNVAKRLHLDLIKGILGKSNVQNGLQMLLQHFQDPLLNKQVSGVIILAYSNSMPYLSVILYDSRRNSSETFS